MNEWLSRIFIVHLLFMGIYHILLHQYNRIAITICSFVQILNNNLVRITLMSHCFILKDFIFVLGYKGKQMNSLRVLKLKKIKGVVKVKFDFSETDYLSLRIKLNLPYAGKMKMCRQIDLRLLHLPHSIEVYSNQNFL